MDVFSSDKFASGTEIIVHHNGTVYWMTPLTIDSQCELNLRSYPFDEHECIISLGVSDYKITEAAFIGKGRFLILRKIGCVNYKTNLVFPSRKRNSRRDRTIDRKQRIQSDQANVANQNGRFLRRMGLQHRYSTSKKIFLG